MKKGQWEYDRIFDDRKPGDIRKEYITYRRTDTGNIERTRVTRIYYANSDYQDSVETIILVDNGE